MSDGEFVLVNGMFGAGGRVKRLGGGWIIERGRGVSSCGGGGSWTTCDSCKGGKTALRAIRNNTALFSSDKKKVGNSGATRLRGETATLDLSCHTRVLSGVWL